MEENIINDASAFSAGAKKNDDELIYIKAIGVGGGGNNAVDHMFNENIKGVSFVNINTDRQALEHSVVPVTLQIGPGLGAGNKPEVARAYAEENLDKIKALFEDETKMVFITAGMGGGTGTGAAPVVAAVAKERGLLTVGIVTIPFLFEGRRKIIKALAGADEMAKNVDALLVINNERLTEIYGDLDFENAFGKADDTLSIAAKSISDIITQSGQGDINCDFKDVDTTLREGGAAIISSGLGEGEGRVTTAIQAALNSPLLKNCDILSSKRLLFFITYNPEAEDKFLMSETNELTDFINTINPDVEVIWGKGRDKSLGNAVKITILAAGFDMALNKQDEEIKPPKPPIRIFPPRKHPESLQPKASEPEPEAIGKRMEEEYGPKGGMFAGPERGAYVVLTPDQLDNDEVCAELEASPAFKRDKATANKIRNIVTPIPEMQEESNGRFVGFN